jgi:hypothetical protein
LAASINISAKLSVPYDAKTQKQEPQDAGLDSTKLRFPSYKFTSAAKPFLLTKCIFGIQISGARYASRSMFETREKIFQLISTLFCEAKRGFVDR